MFLWRIVGLPPLRTRADSARKAAPPWHYTVTADDHTAADNLRGPRSADLRSAGSSNRNHRARRYGAPPPTPSLQRSSTPQPPTTPASASTQGRKDHRCPGQRGQGTDLSSSRSRWYRLRRIVATGYTPGRSQRTRNSEVKPSRPRRPHKQGTDESGKTSTHGINTYISTIHVTSLDVPVLRPSLLNCA